MNNVLEQKASEIYQSMISNSSKRNHNPPQQSKSEFIKWITTQDRWKSITDNWIGSNFNTLLAPSVDRIDTSVGYEVSNMRLVTWVENMEYNFKYNKFSGRTVEIYDIEGNFICEKENVFHASLATGININTLSGNCKKNKSISGGAYQFKFKDSKKKIVNLTNHFKNVKKRPVYMVSLKGDILRAFKSITEALIFLGVNKNKTSGISTICKRGVGIYQGYRWCFADEESYKQLLDNLPSSIVQYDLEGNFVAEYFSVTEAHKTTKIANINVVLDVPNKARGGFQWRTKDSDVEVGVYNPKENINYKKVYQFTKKGEFIAEHESLRKVVEEFGGRKKGYEKSMYGEKPNYKGFKWSRSRYI